MSKKKYLLKLMAANLIAFSSAFVLGMGMGDINESSINRSTTKPQIHVATKAYTIMRLSPVGVQSLDQYMLNDLPKENATLDLVVRVFDDNLDKIVISDNNREILNKDMDDFFGTIRADIRYDKEHSSRHSFVITAVDESGNRTQIRVQTLHNTIVKKETNYRDNEAPYIIFLDKSRDWHEKYTGEGYSALIMYSDKSISQIGDTYKAPFDEELAFSSRIFDEDTLSYKLYINDTLVDEEDFSKGREIERRKALSPAETHFLFYHPNIPRNFPGDKYEIRLEVKDRSNHSATRTVTVIDENER